MDFTTETREGNATYIHRSDINERFDKTICAHIFSKKNLDEDTNDLFTIDARNGKFEWIPDTTENIRNDEQIKEVIQLFQNSTSIVNGDKQKMKEFLLSNLEKVYNIGAYSEFFISITGENFEPSKTWWIIYPQQTITPDGEMGRPMFLTRYHVDEEYEEDSEDFGQIAIPYDLYIKDDGDFIPKEISARLLEDINRICNHVYDITVMYRPRFLFRF